MWVHSYTVPAQLARAMAHVSTCIYCARSVSLCNSVCEYIYTLCPLCLLVQELHLYIVTAQLARAKDGSMQHCMCEQTYWFCKWQRYGLAQNMICGNVFVPKCCVKSTTPNTKTNSNGFSANVEIPPLVRANWVGILHWLMKSRRT
jgi:hypothetical protein